LVDALLTIADFNVLDFELWVFIFIRVSFMVFLMPVIGTAQVPARVKVGITLFLSLIIFSVLPESVYSLPSTVAGFAVLAIRELFVGIVMGFAASLLFIGLNIAGRMIDHNTGFTMIQNMNPLTDSNESVVGQMKVILFSLILIVTGGHLFFIRIISDSFNAIPLLKVNVDMTGITQVLLNLSREAFIYGLKLSAPIMVPLLMATTGLAVVAKIMPQMNVWLVGMPMKIFVGLLTFVFVLPLLWEVFKKQLDSIQFHQLALLKLLGG
jgi:flagellar biosynthetic protein FliR